MFRIRKKFYGEQNEPSVKRHVGEGLKQRNVYVYTWCVQVLRSPNLFKKNYSPQEAENAVISQ